MLFFKCLFLLDYFINEGFRPDKIAESLMETLEQANDRRTKNRLRLMTKLINKMHKKDLMLQNQNNMEKGKQKVLLNTDK